MTYILKEAINTIQQARLGIIPWYRAELDLLDRGWYGLDLRSNTPTGKFNHVTYILN